MMTKNTSNKKQKDFITASKNIRRKKLKEQKKLETNQA